MLLPALVGFLSSAGELVGAVSAVSDLAAEFGAGAEGASLGLDQIPEDWEAGLAGREGEGIRFSDPVTYKSDVRIMPGDPESDFAISQEPYVRWRLDGQDLDINGNPVASTSDEAHIPLTDFKFDPKVYQ